MKRLPRRYKTRWVYAAVSGFSGVLFSILFVMGIRLFSDDFIVSAGPIAMSLLGLIAAPAAAMTWPKNAPRSVARMSVAGILTVFLAFVMIGSVLVIIDIFVDGLNSLITLESVFPLLAIIVLFGSVMSLGIPYLVGALLSVPFSDSKTK
jgi:hypothetical protein